MANIEIMDSAGSEDSTWGTTNLKQAAALLSRGHHMSNVEEHRNSKRPGGRPQLRFVFRRTVALRNDVMLYVDDQLPSDSVTRVFECYERLQDLVHNPPPQVDAG